MCAHKQTQTHTRSLSLHPFSLSLSLPCVSLSLPPLSLSQHTWIYIHIHVIPQNVRKKYVFGLQLTATHCNTRTHRYLIKRIPPTLWCTLTVTYCNSLPQIATHCNTLQHTATHCNTLQHTATYCNTLQHTATQRYPIKTMSQNLQCIYPCTVSPPRN